MRDKFDKVDDLEDNQRVMQRSLFIHGLVLAIFLRYTLGSLPSYGSTTLTTSADEVVLSKPGEMVYLSPAFSPAILKGIRVHPDDPFRFDFILDPGVDKLAAQSSKLKAEAQKLIKYFLASLTIPEKDLWVNLSPYEKDRIIPESFGQTGMGRDLLAQDYMLKQITASLIYPELEIGKQFWKRIYEEAAKKFGTTDVPVNTFNKVWIMPEKAVVYENAQAGTAYVVESKLKVMLEGDYLALQKFEARSTKFETNSKHQNSNVQNNNVLSLGHSRLGFVSDFDIRYSNLGSQIVREIIIPQLTKEINQGKNFAPLRQVYNSLILAAWYKKKLKDSVLFQVYADRNKIKGIDLSTFHVPLTTTHIYDQYLRAFKKGVYNYIKEETDWFTQKSMPRKYFSGGMSLTSLNASRAMGITGNPVSVRHLLRKSVSFVMVIVAITAVVDPLKNANAQGLPLRLFNSDDTAAVTANLQFERIQPFSLRIPGDQVTSIPFLDIPIERPGTPLRLTLGFQYDLAVPPLSYYTQRLPRESNIIAFTFWGLQLSFHPAVSTPPDPDRAMAGGHKGGIDFSAEGVSVRNSHKIDRVLEIKKDPQDMGARNRKASPFVDPVRLQLLLNAPGFVPVILHVHPITDLEMFLDN